MKKIVITAIVAALTMFAQPAMAQQVPGSGDTSTTSGSQSSSNTQVIAIAGGKGEFGGTYNTPGHQTVWTTPSVQGSYFGGTNPCLVGTGGGVAGGPIGFSVNLGRNDAGCTRRSDAAAWHSMGYDNIAIARMCQDTGNADAFFATTGLACPGTGANGRYKLSDGSLAPEMRLVSDARSLPREMRTASVDMNDPAVQQAVQQQARLLAQQMIAQAMQKQQATSFDGQVATPAPDPGTAATRPTSGR